MIQGIRIPSTNLSGLTANVTFSAETGGTINLSGQTIPFNNISDYPYGTYELEVPLYDRTYEIIVPAPLTGQSAYTETVRTVTVDGGAQPFSGAVLSEVWGTYTTEYVTNEGIPSTDIVLVVGANDVTNPAAKSDPNSPIFGMPILDVASARTIFFIKRSMASGYAGIQNELFFQDNTLMLFGDAKKVIEDIVKSFDV